MRAPIQSVKHIVQSSIFTVAFGAITQVQPAIAVLPANVDLNSEVEEGSIIKAIYLEYWITSDDAAQSTVTFSLEKINTTQTVQTFAQSQALGNYANKKNILYITQGITSTNVGTPTPFVRGWFKIPKGKQRFGLGDKIVVNISAVADGLNVCGVAIYKSVT